ncbi:MULTISPECIES: (2Fe-2S) ferredoxin domain-containing protein [Oscillatoriophycideae]|uniref:(2Fe-2S) ferredoxin domain-containing protein n=1 Tax=Aerosakkonema funiforme FACHB-1375 TaxID=2949571 RepID=A0A926VAY0_9CYAN|nr:MULTISPECIES: (2Fe-2S) ferredoxin domain-containing protein [Oscillatoriales]MBD2180195.1 (2Fe-2S) ferredoxin domain-containing protein [Aerosakkonema funiforme FACHB-1375]MBD3560808.1 (2Fe-2S) ferredoxin domain-containing protein [Planktothrix sp. FACHB-1355]
MAEPRCVLICQNRSCLNNSSAEVLTAFQAAEVPGVRVESSGCMGQCSSGPTVRIVPDETWYCRVKTSDVPEIVERHLIGGKLVEAKLNPRIHLRMEMFSS